MGVDLSKETVARGKAEVAALRRKLRDQAAGTVPTEPDDDLETEDSEPIDTWQQRKDLQ